MKIHQFLTAVALLSPAVHADVVTVPASKDNTLYETLDGSLSNATGQYFFAGRTFSGVYKRGIIAFDVAGMIPAGSTINSASLRLHMSRTNNGAQTVSLQRALVDWGEETSQATGQEGGGAASAPGDATWLHSQFPGTFWSTTGGDFSAAVSSQTSVSGIAFYVWNGLASDVQSWLDTPSGNFGWFMIGNEGSAQTSKRFDTRENVDPAFWPELTVDFDPPTSGFLDFCSGDGGDQMGCTDCPCMNKAPAGTIGGCINGGGSAARLIASGSASVSRPAMDLTDLRFELSGAPPTAFCILNSGDGVAPGSMSNPCFGQNSGAQAMQFDGLRCAITNTRRHGGRSADALGAVGVTNNPWGGEGGPPAGIAVAGAGFVAGQTRYFQVINRDDPLAVCLRGLNTSQAVRVTFEP